jgi:hypothetical protein
MQIPIDLDDVKTLVDFMLCEADRYDDLVEMSNDGDDLEYYTEVRDAMYRLNGWFEQNSGTSPDEVAGT